MRAKNDPLNFRMKDIYDRTDTVGNCFRIFKGKNIIHWFLPT